MPFRSLSWRNVNFWPNLKSFKFSLSSHQLWQVSLPLLKNSNPTEWYCQYHNHRCIVVLVICSESKSYIFVASDQNFFFHMSAMSPIWLIIVSYKLGHFLTFFLTNPFIKPKFGESTTNSCLIGRFFYSRCWYFKLQQIYRGPLTAALIIAFFTQSVSLDGWSRLFGNVVVPYFFLNVQWRK